jgi:hypothetical protein
MATPVDIGSEGSGLGTLVAAYLSAAEAGRTLDRAGRRYSPAGVRSLRRALAQVEAAAGPLDAATLKLMDAAAIGRLSRQVVEHAGLPPSRLGTIVDALRGLAAYTGARHRPADPPPADPPPLVDPPPWVDPPAWTDPPLRAAPKLAPHSPSAAAPEARTPTFTMLALGSHVSAWIERIIVIAFVLTLIGLALELV